MEIFSFIFILFSLEYGGTQPPFDNTIWRQRLLNNAEYFIKLESYNDGGAINNNNIDIYQHQNDSMNDEVGDDEIFYEAEDDADDNKSLDVEIDGNSLHFIDTETEDSEEYDSDRMLSPKRNAPPIESLEEMFLKHEFSTFTLKEQEFEVNPWMIECSHLSFRGKAFSALYQFTYLSCRLFFCLSFRFSKEKTYQQS